MKRAVICLVAVVAGLLVSLGVAAPAGASCPPEGPSVRYTISNVSYTYYSTNLYSAWESLSHGGTINYSENKTGTTSATASASVTAKEGVIFASVSTTVGISVGKTWSDSRSWSYTADVPADSAHKYRLHMYHYSVTFKVHEQYWNPGACTFKENTQHGFPTTVTHAPATSRDQKYNVWRLDKANA